VDRFTDAHPIPRASRNRIGPERRRYGGVLVDVFYDHFLARHWSEFHPEPLDRFTARCYAALRAHEPVLPERLRLALPHMVEHDWLGSYREVDGIALTLARLSRRVRRENPLAGGAEELIRHYDALEADFRAFLPDLVREVRGESAGPPLLPPGF
jgi:acyl carrier protein phosphodiesterase